VFSYLILRITPPLLDSHLARLTSRMPVPAATIRGSDRSRPEIVAGKGFSMPIEFVSGDLFANTHNVEAFAHGCNCQGSMGAGVAKGFRERYPEMYEQFRGRCKADPRRFNLGDAWLWKEEGKTAVFNLGTQERFWHARASYEAVEQALTAMREQADAEGITSIAIPRIGVGYGGLSWKKVRVIVERVFADWPGRLVVYEEFVPVANEQDA
jgi:O-acetyl-ADP-ribose deacetylase (regulator of RNase III)